MSQAPFKDILTESCRTFWMSSVQSMWMIFSFSLMNCCINIKIMYKRYYYDFEKLATNWHWQMWVWSQVNQVSKVHSESEKSVQMNSQKMKTIMNWQAFKSVKSVQSFIDFANFYWKFIKNFSNLIMSMMTLIQKNTSFKWTEKADQSFKKLKTMFISVSILVSFDHTCMTVMKTDFSDWCIDETLLQLMNNVWRLCAYYSKKNASAECNYEIYDKEMLIIIQCLKEWDAELRSVSSFQICTDHKNLKYFMTVKSLQSDKWGGL
jgi:hypothetical protein